MLGEKSKDYYRNMSNRALSSYRPGPSFEEHKHQSRRGGRIQADPNRPSNINYRNLRKALNVKKRYVPNLRRGSAPPMDFSSRLVTEVDFCEL